MAQPLGVTPDHTLGQELARSIEFLYPNSVLETRQRRLRSQIATFRRIAIQKQSVNRVSGQASRDVGIGVRAGDRDHSLRHQRAHRMSALSRSPLISKVGRSTSQ